MDVTARKMIEQERSALLEAERAARLEAERLARLKDDFLATVSHELRSPLNAIVGWSQLLLRGSAEPGRAGEVIHRNASSLARIVEDLLDMNRVISGKMRLKFCPVELTDVVSSVLEGIGPGAEAKGLRVGVHIDPRLAPLHCDEDRIRQIIWNLLTNAVKFTPAEGRIEVTIRDRGKEVEIAVSDTGQGIPAEFLPSMFDRFRQYDSSLTRQHCGLGLGLSIVKSLVEMHGGSVRAESPGEGRGATFTVTLPRDSGDGIPGSWAYPGRQTGEDGDSGSCLRGLRVLVIDDDADHCELLSRCLEETGMSVVAAGSAEEALACLRESSFDALVSDIGMPGIDGYQLIRTVRAQGHEAMVCVALTGLSRPEDRARALEAGYDGHVVKPFDAASLLSSMARLLTARSDPHGGATASPASGG